MPRSESRAALASTARASHTTTLETTSLYAADMSDARPLSERFTRHAASSRRFITVGSEERGPHGVLRCFAKDGRVVVELRKGRKRVGRALWVAPDDASLLEPGARVPEDAFSVEIRELIGSPWHELNYVAVWTVRGLREKGTAEAWVDL